LSFIDGWKHCCCWCLRLKWRRGGGAFLVVLLLSMKDNWKDSCRGLLYSLRRLEKFFCVFVCFFGFGMDVLVSGSNTNHNGLSWRRWWYSQCKVSLWSILEDERKIVSLFSSFFLLYWCIYDLIYFLVFFFFFVSRVTGFVLLLKEKVNSQVCRFALYVGEKMGGFCCFFLVSWERV